MKHFEVASFTDAWIETTCELPFRTSSKSHLLQMRGLKPYRMQIIIGNSVASFTDAWIETVTKTKTYHLPESRIFYRCVD